MCRSGVSNRVGLFRLRRAYLLALVHSLHPDDVGVVDQLHDGDLGRQQVFLLGAHVLLHDHLHGLALQRVLVHAPFDGGKTTRNKTNT